MFGSFANLISSAPHRGPPPENIPPPTPVTLPVAHVQLGDKDSSTTPREPLAVVLQGLIRPSQINEEHFRALGVHVTPDASHEALLPDSDFVPDFEVWDALSADEARAANERTRKPLDNGVVSPGVQTYQDRVKELRIPNEAAYRVVRRLPPRPGVPQARLGNSYEFYRNLEAFTTYWDDTSKPPVPAESATEKAQGGPSEAKKEEGADKPGEPALPTDPEVLRTCAGHQTPPEIRFHLLAAFIKLVAYDFGCNVSAPRTEPRLHLTTPEPKPLKPRSSYFASGCTFIFRTPRTREAARAGMVEGPVAAVTARSTTTFEHQQDALVDLGRELVAAVLTAQHRARQGRTEKRFGEGAWWTTKPRWGGGPGGPIGREIEKDGVAGDKDAPPTKEGVGGAGSAEIRQPAAKRPKKNMAIYDNYRMVRPPAASWDKKAVYQPIGRRSGADYDDVFVLSSLFHHFSVLRVRVPLRLLDVLDGAPEGHGAERSWGRLEAWRSPWYDFFLVEDRVEALRLVWSTMAYLMRKVDEKPSDKDGQGDVKMANA